MEIPTMFFEDHPNPMLIYDTETLEIIAVNKAAVEKYGYSRDEFKQITIEDIRPPEDISILREELQKIGEEPKELHKGQFRHQTKGGDIIFVQITAQPFPMEGRNARIVHIHDITETVRLKNEIEEAYHDQQQHIDSNPLAMVKYDKDFRVTEWSSRAEEKTGYSKEEVLGTSTYDLGIFDEEEVDFVKKHMLQIASNKKDKDRFETVINTKDGDRMDVLVHASALRSSEGDLKSVLAFIENITDRKDYERQLEKREEKYYRLFEDANDGIFLMSDLKYVDCNERITEILGGSKEEIIGKTPMDLSPEKQPDGTPSAEKAHQKMSKARQGNPQVFEWEHKSFDGRKIDVEVSLNKIELGKDNYIQAIVRDLTEHKQVKSELEAEKKRLEQAQKLARIGYWSYDIKNDHFSWSDLLYEILDVGKEDFDDTMESFRKHVHPEDRDKIQKINEKLLRTSGPVDYNLRMVNPKGEVIFTRCRAQGEFDESGELSYINGVSQDITEQQKAQNELRRNEELFESLFRDSPVAIAMIDTEGRVQKLNKSFEDLFGYSEKELVGNDILKYQLPKERHDEIPDIYENVFSDEGSSKYYEDQRITKQGDTKHLLVGALPVIIDDEPIGAFGMYIDITKLRATEQYLKESLEEKEILLSEIHHRVKNNLAIISGLLLLEAMNWDDDTVVNEVLMQSKSRIHSMAKIHEKLYQSQDFANLDFENYVSELVDTISKSIIGDKQDVEIDIDCDDISLNINQALPSALIINELVTNSFKYAFDGRTNGKLKVRFKRKGEKMHIIVADNGPGLPEDFDKMVETSLGHQLVSQLVKQLKGKIDVESGKESGTRYEITFEKSDKSGSAASGQFV